MRVIPPMKVIVALWTTFNEYPSVESGLSFSV